MPSMASSIHPDFRDDVTSAEAHAVDRETERLIHQQMAADNASGRERYIQLAKEMLRIRLRAYKPESPPVAGAWCLIGSAHLKASQLQEAKEATEKSLEIYAAGNDAEKENSAALAREQLGLIFEGLGQISDAKEIRLQEEVQALTPGKERKGSLTPKRERKASRAKYDPNLKRRRKFNKTPDLQANSKRSRRNTRSAPITPEDKAAAKRAF
ncbi:uncharacterized protein J4E84_009963 [Alternaria hordeiaustralica]|uniref:uncharacterized protein n=1 Tax=Alternaria hordeiaustralica TaxID=1187925 RepID=UPI0020C24592|nr:uncharacterized protein J4E84_009963 [Alternaria hordeiaustralica]KAI4675810.1 hypothetical protein J4E84_009963 [Alternaria hordeiaustralica]